MKEWLFSESTSSQNSTSSLERRLMPKGKRKQHYIFARWDLPRHFFPSPDSLLRILSTDFGTSWLQQLWKTTGDRLYQNSDGPSLSSNGLWVKQVEFSFGTFPVINFPTPEKVAEVFFATILRDKEKSWRYFVLEKLERSHHGVLCEWADRNCVSPVC